MGYKNAESSLSSVILNVLRKTQPQLLMITGREQNRTVVRLTPPQSSLGMQLKVRFKVAFLTLRFSATQTHVYFR